MNNKKSVMRMSKHIANEKSFHQCLTKNLFEESFGKMITPRRKLTRFHHRGLQFDFILWRQHLGQSCCVATLYFILGERKCHILSFLRPLKRFFVCIAGQAILLRLIIGFFREWWHHVFSMYVLMKAMMTDRFFVCVDGRLSDKSHTPIFLVK